MRPPVPRPVRYQSFPLPDGDSLPPALPQPLKPKPHPNPLSLHPLGVLDSPHMEGSASVTRSTKVANSLRGSPHPPPASDNIGKRVASQDDPGSWPKQAPAGFPEPYIRNPSLPAPEDLGLDQFTTPFALPRIPPPMTARHPEDSPLSSFRWVLASFTLHWATSWDLCQAQRLWTEGLPMQG